MQNLPADESSELDPENDYGRSKMEAEKLIKAWAEAKDGRKALIMRPTVVFGAHNYGNIFNLMRNVDRGTNVEIGNKSVIKSTAYVENLIEATKFLFETVDLNYSVFNYADTPHLTNFEISSTIGEAMDKGGAIKIPYGLAITLGAVFDVLGRVLNKEMVISTKRVKKFCTSTYFRADKVLEFGFEPKYTTKEAIFETTKWFTENHAIWEKEFDNLKKLFKANYGITIE